MGLAILVLGLALFLGAHVFVTLRTPRAALIKDIGEGRYKGLMALVSLAGLVLIGYGFGQYRATGWIDVWSPPPWTYYVTQILMWPASIFVVAAYSRGNIWRALKHPMLIGVKTWAAAHLISNGDFGSIVLFGSFLVWAGYDRMTLKHRSDPGARWQVRRYVNVPSQAEGFEQLHEAPSEIDLAGVESVSRRSRDTEIARSRR